MLAAGLMLHLGIEYSMNLPLFEWIMMTAYVSFVDSRDIERALIWARGRIAKLETA